MKGVSVGKVCPCSRSIQRLRRVTSLYGVHLPGWYPLHSRALVPESEFPQEPVPSPLDQKAMLGVRVIPLWHSARPTLWRGGHDVWNMWRGQKSRGCWEREGKRRDRAQASCSVVQYIFSVTACISTPRACAFLLNDSPWKAHLATVATDVCVCDVSWGYVSSPVGVSWPLPCCCTHRTSKEQLMGYTWSVWYSEASDRLSEKLRKFSWYSEQTIS